MATVTNIADSEDVDVDVVLMQHLSNKEFRDETTKNTLRVLATSTQIVGKQGIQRVLTVEIENDLRQDNGDKLRISKTLSDGDPKRIDNASIEVVRTVENFRPVFPRLLAELSASAGDGITVGALKREGEKRTCFVELADSGRRLRCIVGDFEQLYEFRVALTHAANF